MNSDTPREQEEAYRKRRDEMLRLLECHLGAYESPLTLAERACISPSHFHREFSRALGETPGSMERRLRLERAASDLRGTRRDVTEISLEAGYESLEGFSRAFRRAYGLPPSRYRIETSAPETLPARSKVHFSARNRGLEFVSPQGVSTMDLTDRMIDTDYWCKKRLLESAATLTDAQLDAPLVFRHNLIPFAEPERTLREALSRMTGDGWAIGMMDAAQWPSPNPEYRHSLNNTVPDMLARLEGFHRDYSGFVQHVKANDFWETPWLDDACEPAETFTYGTTIEGTLTWGIAQRMVVQRLLEQLGLPWRP